MSGTSATAGGGAFLGAVISLWRPEFRGLVEAAAALGTLAWLPEALAPRRFPDRGAVGPPAAAVLGVVAGFGLLLGAPVPWSEAGALLLGGTALGIGALPAVGRRVQGGG